MSSPRSARLGKDVGVVVFERNFHVVGNLEEFCVLFIAVMLVGFALGN